MVPGLQSQDSSASAAEVGLIEVDLGSAEGMQHYRLLLDVVPGAPAALCLLLHPEDMPVIVVPVEGTQHLSVTTLLPAAHR